MQNTRRRRAPLYIVLGIAALCAALMLLLANPGKGLDSLRIYSDIASLNFLDPHTAGEAQDAYLGDLKPLHSDCRTLEWEGRSVTFCAYEFADSVDAQLYYDQASKRGTQLDAAYVQLTPSTQAALRDAGIEPSGASIHDAILGPGANWCAAFFENRAYRVECAGGWLSNLFGGGRNTLRSFLSFLNENLDVAIPSASRQLEEIQQASEGGGIQGS